MPKIRIALTRDTKSALKQMQKDVSDRGYIVDEAWKKDCEAFIIQLIRTIRDCSQQSIVKAYARNVTKLLDRHHYDRLPSPQGLYEAFKHRMNEELSKEYTDNSYDNNIDRYFNDVKREYIYHPQNESDDLLFCDENKDIFIKNNLKLVVSCAKRYRNLGVPFDDLIQAGNEGLLAAFDRFDVNKSKLRDNIINDVKSRLKDNIHIDYKDAEDFIRTHFTYGKLLDKTLKALPKDGFINKNAFIEWVKANVRPAIFASVAFQWIRASILVEISNTGTIIKMPKSLKNIAKYIVSLDEDNPYTHDNYHDNEIAQIANDEFVIEDNRLENDSTTSEMQSAVSSLLLKLTPSERRVLRKRYGIGLPYSMTVFEIAENEHVSISSIKIQLQSAQDKLASLISDDEKEYLISLICTQ